MPRRKRSQFEWLSAKEAAVAQEEELAQGRAAVPIDRSLANLSSLTSDEGYATDYELLTGSTLESKRFVSRLRMDTQAHLEQLAVLGADAIGEEELKKIGPYLARDASYREDAIFYILRSRQREVTDSVVKPLMVVNLRHVLQYGLATQTGTLDVEKIQTQKTDEARELLGTIISEDELEDNLLSSDMQRRILRALYYIITEPVPAMEKFLARLKKEAAEDDGMKAEEVLARTYRLVNRLYERRTQDDGLQWETEEDMVRLMEEARLKRLAGLGNVALTTGLSIIAADRYEDENENGDSS